MGSNRQVRTHDQKQKQRDFSYCSSANLSRSAVGAAAVAVTHNTQRH